MEKQNVKFKKMRQAPLEIRGLGKKRNEGRPLTGQERQDKIFQKMSAERKLEIGAQLWQLAKALAGNKINYGTRRSKTSFNRD